MPAAAIYLVVALLAAVENVFPPVPADTAVALGAFLAGPGGVSAPVIFLITWVCNVASAAVMYLLARRVGRPFVESRTGQRLLRPEAVARLARWYDRYGTWSIFFSRFIPGVRAVVPPFAGIVGLSAPRALLPAAAASAIWYGTLTYLVSRYVDELHDVARFVDRVSGWTLAGVGSILALILVTALVWRRTK